MLGSRLLVFDAVVGKRRCMKCQTYKRKISSKR
jgi:hypothetical protein